MRRLGVIAVFLVLVATACGNATDDSSGSTDAPDVEVPTDGGEANRDEVVARPGVPGVSDDEIVFDVVGTKTGNPLGTCILDCYRDGIEAYFAFRNSEGGIYGRDLVIGEVLDDEVAQNQQKSLDVISRNEAFGVFQATLLATGWADLDDAGIPVYAWGINSTEAANRSRIFPSLTIRCADCPRAAVPWVASQVDATKAAAIGYGVSENSKVCTNTNAEAFRMYEEDTGVEVVYVNDTLDFGLPNGIGPEVSAMKEAGVDFIATCVDLNGMKTLSAELDRQNMDDVVLMHPNSYSEEFVADGSFDGDVVSVQFRPFEYESGASSGLDDYLAWVEEQGTTPNELSMVGWINAATAFEGLLAAGPEFDRDKVVAATNAMTDFSADGLLDPIDWTVAHTTYTNDDRKPDSADCSAFVRVEDGTFVPFDDRPEPWKCWPEGVKVDLEPEPADFD